MIRSIANRQAPSARLFGSIPSGISPLRARMLSRPAYFTSATFCCISASFRPKQVRWMRGWRLCSSRITLAHVMEPASPAAIVPPAPQVTLQKSGRSLLRCSRVARSLATPASLLGGKNSNETIGLPLPKRWSILTQESSRGSVYGMRT